MIQDSKPQKAKGRATEFDIRLGQRLKRTRLMAGLSQDELAYAVDVSFQQIQKYEKGTNRISAEKLRAFCILLKKPCEWFLSLPENDYEDLFIIENAGMLRTFGKLPQDVQIAVKSHIFALAKAFAKVD